MNTTSVTESLKYGGRLFGLFLAITVVGGGLGILGTVLASPEVGAFLADGTAGVEMATLAGGIILLVLGVATLAIGQFAIVYKIIADSVSKGVTLSAPDEKRPAARAENPPSETGQQASVEPSAKEQPAQQSTTGQPVETDQPESVENGPEVDRGPTETQTPDETDVGRTESVSGNSQTAREDPVTESTSQESDIEDRQESSAATVEEPAEEIQQATGDQQADQSIAKDEQQTEYGRERTAEEIAFGKTAPEEPGDEKSETGQPVAGEDWFEEGDTEQTEGASQQAERTDQSAAETEQPVPEDEEMFSDDEADESDTETANDGSNDPLSEDFGR